MILNKYYTTKVTTMRNMFNGCTSLEYLDISKFVSENCNDFTSMFGQCKALTVKMDKSKNPYIFQELPYNSKIEEI